MKPQQEAFYTAVRSGELGSRWCLWTQPPAGAPSALVVYAHPLAEEMNKSRRMVALQARALAVQGFAVLQMDALGCGDSAGSMQDARWPDWVDDLVHAVAIARLRFTQRWPSAPAPALWLWGLRSGALLACEAAKHIDTPLNLLFWQPAISGKTTWQQFLRLAKVSMALGKGGGTNAADTCGDTVAGADPDTTPPTLVAGYRLHPLFGAGLSAATLAPPALASRMVWLDISPQVAPEPTPATRLALDAWKTAGCTVEHRHVTGPAFWQTTEIEEAPALLQATLNALNSGAAP